MLLIFEKVGAPHLILFKTYRLHGHTASDPASYRTNAEVEADFGKKTLIARCSELLLRVGVQRHH